MFFSYITIFELSVITILLYTGYEFLFKIKLLMGFVLILSLKLTVADLEHFFCLGPRFVLTKRQNMQSPIHLYLLYSGLSYQNYTIGFMIVLTSGLTGLWIHSLVGNPNFCFF